MFTSLLKRLANVLSGILVGIFFAFLGGVAAIFLIGIIAAIACLLAGIFGCLMVLGVASAVVLIAVGLVGGFVLGFEVVNSDIIGLLDKKTKERF